MTGVCAAEARAGLRNGGCGEMLAVAAGGIIRKILVPRSFKCRWDVGRAGGGGGVGQARRAGILAGIFLDEQRRGDKLKEFLSRFLKNGIRHAGDILVQVLASERGWTCNVLVSRTRLLCLTVWIEYINDF